MTELYLEENDITPIKEPSELLSLTFSLLSSEEIEKLSVVEVKESRLSGENSVYDPRLGVIKNNTICVTCGKGPHDCSGHLGHIALPVPIPHPMYIKEIVFYLNLFCSRCTNTCDETNKCSRLCMTEKEMRLLGFTKLKGINKLNKISEYVENLSSCSHCNYDKYHYYNEDKVYYRYVKDKSDRETVSFEDIEIILSNITDEDLEMIGLKTKTRHIVPMNFIINNLIVLPICARPYVETNRGSCDDDLTTRYVEIVKLCMILNSGIKKSKNLTEKDRKETISKIYSNIDTMMYNHKKKAKQINGRPIKCIRDRLNGKNGLFRQNLSAKRNDYCARSVIDGDPTTGADEIIIPYEFSTKLTFPERVFAYNLFYLQYLVNNGKANYVEREENGEKKIYNLSKSLQTRNTYEINKFILKDGDIVVRGQTMININNEVLQRYKSKYGKEFCLLPNDRVVRNKKFIKNIKPSEVIEFSLECGDKVLRNGVFYEPYKMKLLDKDFTLTEGDRVYRKGVELPNITIAKKKEFQLKNGDIVRRHLRDGDIVLFGRQPTLHKGSMIARYIKIQENTSGINNGRNPRVIRMNLAQCKTYNADFDGDEMNIYLPQSYDTVAELQLCASTKSHIKTSQSSKMLLEITQDALTAGYLFTCGNKNINGTDKNFDRYNKIDKETFNDSIIQVDEWFEKGCELTLIGNSKAGTIPNIGKQRKRPYEKLWNGSKTIWEKLDHIRKVLIWKGWKQDELDNFIYTGHGLFSLLLPDDFEYTFQTIYITRGVMIRGTLNKGSLGGGPTSIVHKIEKNYGADPAIDFVSWFQWIFCDVLIHRGFSIGMDDCKPIKEKEISDVISKSFIEAQSVVFSENDEELKERKVNIALNSAINIGQTITKDSVEFTNSLNTMILAGSKGSYINVANIRSFVGQQNLGGQRLPLQYSGRTLPCYPKNLEETLTNSTPEEDEQQRKSIYESRGFISNCYMNGLNPREFYLHAVTAREGVCDTAIKTASSGYIQRKLVKKMEDLVCSYQPGLIVNSKNMVIQFDYGDNIDPARSVKKSDGTYSFIDLESVANKLNTDVEFDNWKMIC